MAAIRNDRDHLLEHGSKGAKFILSLFPRDNSRTVDLAIRYLRSLDDGNAREVLIDEIEERGWDVHEHTEGYIDLIPKLGSNVHKVSGRDLEEALDNLIKCFGDKLPPELRDHCVAYCNRCVSMRSIGRPNEMNRAERSAQKSDLERVIMDLAEIALARVEASTPISVPRDLSDERIKQLRDKGLEHCDHCICMSSIDWPIKPDQAEEAV